MGADINILGTGLSYGFYVKLLIAIDHYMSLLLTIWRLNKNEMNGVLGYLCAHIGQTGPGEPPEDGEMNEMTLPSRHRIRNS